MLSIFYKIIVHTINLVLLILSMPIMPSFQMNFGLYVCSIIITKIFIDHQIKTTSEILSAKPEKFDGNNLRRWQNQMRFQLTTLNPITAIENDHPSSSRPTTRQSSTTKHILLLKLLKRLSIIVYRDFQEHYLIDYMTSTTPSLVLKFFGILQKRNMAQMILV